MLAKKLHLKSGMRVAVANAPAGFSLGTTAGVTIERSLTRGLDLVLLFATSQKALKAQWGKALAAVRPDGALWVSYPKKSSGIAADLGMGEPIGQVASVRSRRLWPVDVAVPPAWRQRAVSLTPR